jgi:hypothetical protein
MAVIAKKLCRAEYERMACQLRREQEGCLGV